MRQLVRLGLCAVATVGALSLAACDEAEDEVPGGNRRPEVSALEVTSEEDARVVIDFLASSKDADGNRLRVLSATIDGQVVALDATGKTSFLPPANFHGTLPLAFSVSDGSTPVGGTGTLTIRPVQDPVTTTGSSQTLGEDGSQAFSLTATDVDGDPLTFEIAAGPAHGTLSGTAPDLVYTPAANYFGPDTVRYQVSDGHSTAAADVTFNVLPVNDAPVAVAKTVSLSEDSAHAFALEGTDLEGNALTYAVTQQPAHGVLLGTGANRTYQPAANYFGPDEIRFVVNDGLLTSGVATVTFEVASVDDPTTAQPVTVAATEDTAALVTLRGADGDGTPVSYTTSAPAHGTLSGTAPTLTYTPELNYNGIDSFTYTATAEGSTPATATVTVNIAAVNDAPVPVNATVSTEEDTAVAIQLQASDVDSTSLVYSIVSPYEGTVTGTPPGISYTPPANFSGTLTLGFYASDSSGGSSRGNLTIAVTPVNDAPVAIADYVATDAGEPLEIAVLSNDSDVDGEPLVIEDVSDPAHGSAVIEGGKVIYTPQDGFTGIDSLTYTLADGAGATSTAAIQVGVDDFPTGVPLQSLVPQTTGGSRNDSLRRPSISRNGRYVAFSTIRGLVPDDTNGISDAYVYDRGKRTLQRVSVKADGSPANGAATEPQLSGNGRYVVFVSIANNLIPGDTNATYDVFRRDLRTGEVVRISVSSQGVEANGPSQEARISDDGNLVVFSSTAFNLVASDVNGARDIFVRDVAAGTTTRVSVSPSGGDADVGSSSPVISGDGRRVAFVSTATNLVSGDDNAMQDVFVRDLAAGTTLRASVSTNGGEANGPSYYPAISHDGRFVAFSSLADNLTPGGESRTLVRDTTSLITTGAPYAFASSLSLSGDGRYLTVHDSSFTGLLDRFAGLSSSLIAPGSARWYWPALSGNGRYIAVVEDPSGAIIVLPNPR